VSPPAMVRVLVVNAARDCSVRRAAGRTALMRDCEKEKLLELQKKLADQQQHLKRLEESSDEIAKSQGGEHN